MGIFELLDNERLLHPAGDHVRDLILSLTIDAAGLGFAEWVVWRLEPPQLDSASQPYAKTLGSSQLIGIGCIQPK